jgi:DNA topoisomerase-1
MKNLVIVESPTKARTLKKYLGNNFDVLASAGHIKDLPKKELGIDIEGGFEVHYQYLPGKKKIVDEIKKASKGAEKIYIASDPDREGEAIAWHLYNEIKKGKSVYRALFNEITKDAVEKGIKNPVDIDLKKVDSQKSRRVLDRLVGYLISPLLWKPLKYGLSAGRVQTAALRLICEREAAIEAFKPEEYWNIIAELTFNALSFEAKLVKENNKKITIKNKEQADLILKTLKEKEFIISKINEREQKKSPPKPLITSTLQQEAYKRYGFSAKKTMMLAQRLYEGIDLGPEGPIGLITYMRTDSIRVSDEAANQAKKYIAKIFGKDFVGSNTNSGKSKGKVQDAHEAIRPTYIDKTPEKIKAYLESDIYKLYKLIWEIFIASQMKEAIYNLLEIYISADKYIFFTSTKKCIFEGFEKVLGNEKDQSNYSEFANLKEGISLKLKDLKANQNFTTPPARYTYASLIKELEDKGVGRPSTYANIISTILERNYVEIKSKYFHPTELGRLVNKVLIANFPNVFDINFTAKMEEFLDEIEKGEYNWKEVIEKFYNNFSRELEVAKRNFTGNLELQLKCPECGQDLTFKYGKNGLFVACTNYPKCKYTSDFARLQNGSIELVKREDKQTDIICKKCGGKMVIKTSKNGEFLGCSNYPDCNNIEMFIRDSEEQILPVRNGDKLNEECPKCKGTLLIKSGKNGLFAGCSNYPDCKFTCKITVKDNKIVPLIINVDELFCEKCGKKMVLKRSRRGAFFACSGYPDCKNTKKAVLVDNLLTVKEKVSINSE